MVGGEPPRLFCFDWELQPTEEHSLPWLRVRGMAAVGVGEEQELWVFGSPQGPEATTKLASELGVRWRAGRLEPLRTAGEEVQQRVGRLLRARVGGEVLVQQVLVYPLVEQTPASPVPVLVQVMGQRRGWQHRGWWFFKGEMDSASLTLARDLFLEVREKPELTDDIELDQDRAQAWFPPDSTFSQTAATLLAPGKLALVLRWNVPIPQENGVANAVSLLAVFTGTSLAQLGVLNVRPRDNPSYFQKLMVNGRKVWPSGVVLGFADQALLFPGHRKPEPERADEFPMRCAVFLALP